MRNPRRSTPSLWRTALRRGGALVLTANVLACSAGGDARSDTSLGTPSGGRASSGLGTGGSSPSGTGAGGMATTGRAGSGPIIQIGGDGSAGQPAQAGSGQVCQAESREGQRIPVDMYFLVDSSGSMEEQVMGGAKWDVVSGALVTFLNDPRNAETAVGIGYFPVDTPQGTCTFGQAGCLCIPIINFCLQNDGGSCVASDYAKPAVPLSLPPAPSPVIADIESHMVSGGTPTRPALEGALQYLDGWAGQHTDRKVVLVLATDGEPTGCDTNTPQDVATLAAGALAGPYGIKTFVIGVGNSLRSLNLIAKAGGTDQAFLVDTNGDVAKEFADALDQIRGVASSCDFSIPKGNSPSMVVNPSKVNVRYTPTGASASTLVAETYQSDANNCTSDGGWYYDNPSAPTTIKLCPTTCASLNGGSIQVEFGCDTIVQPPR